MIHGGGGSNLLFGGDGDDILDVRWLTADHSGEEYGRWRDEKRLSTDEMHGGAGNERWKGVRSIYYTAGREMTSSGDRTARIVCSAVTGTT